MSFTYTDEFQYKDNNVVDTYRKLRISNQYGVLNSSMQNSVAAEDWENFTSGTGSITYLDVESAANLTIGTASGDRAMRQTLETFQQQAGTGTNVLMTGVLGSTQVGTSSRLGIYDDFNGIFFEVKDGVFGVVLRRTLSVGVTENIRIDQANFNKDKLDGTGHSKYNIDITKAQLFNIDYAWLGVGRVRLSVWTGDCFCVAHEFMYNNILTSAFMGKGDLPLRYEIVNTAAVGASSTMKQICAAVFAEGGLNPRGFSRAALTPANTEYDLPNNTDFFSLVTVRVKAGQDRVTIQPESMSTTLIAGDSIHMCLFLNANFTTPLVWQDVDAFCEYSQTNSIVTGGTLIAAENVEKEGTKSLNLDFIKDRISTRYDGTLETLCLAVRKIKGGTKTAGSMNFIVYR